MSIVTSDSRVWHHYGQWQCMSQMPPAQQIPVSAVHMSGWIVLRNESWFVSVPNMDLDLLLSKSDMDFLRECATAQLSCWTSGFVFITRHTRMMLPQDIVVYFISNDTTSPMPSATLGRMLADNINYWSLQNIWSKLFCSAGARNGPTRSLHPLTHLQLPASHREDNRWELCLGYVFTLHVQAQIHSGSYRFFGASTCQLGYSDYHYDYCTESCVRAEDAFRDFASVPQGCIIMAQSAPSLLLAARGCCIAPVKDHEQILLVAPKEALPALQIMLEGLDVHYVLNRQDAQYAHLRRTVLVTSQLLKALPTVLQASWQRVILFDWHRIWKHLSRYFYMQDCIFSRRQMQVVLMLADEVSGAKRRPPYTLQELGAALGIHPVFLGTAAKTKDLMYERILSIEDEKTVASNRVCVYETCCIAPPNSEEMLAAEKYAGHKRTIAAQLGTLVEARSSVRTLRTNQTLQQFFDQGCSQQPISAFAQTSFSSNLEDRKCAICMHDECSAVAVTRCGHWFCVHCITQATCRGYNKCPLCRSEIANAGDVVIVDKNKCAHTTFFENLTTFLRLRLNNLTRYKVLALCSFGSSMERVARALRLKGLCAVAWSGNAAQLAQHLKTFKSSDTCVMLYDSEFLSLQWVEDLADVQEICCILPLDTECNDVCCQLRDALKIASKARLTFVWDKETSRLPSEKPTCECIEKRQCPILIHSLNQTASFCESA